MPLGGWEVVGAGAWGQRSPEAAVRSFLRDRTLVGLLPVPHPIMVRRFETQAQPGRGEGGGGGGGWTRLVPLPDPAVWAQDHGRTHIGVPRRPTAPARSTRGQGKGGEWFNLPSATDTTVPTSPTGPPGGGAT